MVTAVAPYAPSASWMASYLDALWAGMSKDKAVAHANCETEVAGKDFARCTIRGADSRQLTLSVAVAGGASLLKRRGAAAKAQVSEHGNWRHAHMGALEAAYGRTPFFPHLIDGIRDIILSDIQSLPLLNDRLLDALTDFIGMGEGCRQAMTSTAFERGMELVSKVDAGLSVIDAAMHLGPSALLALRAMTAMQHSNAPLR